MTREAELKRILNKLQTRATQAANADYRGAPARIRRMLDLVRDSEELSTIIEQAPEPERDPMEVLDERIERRGRLPVPKDDLEYLGFLHALLDEMTEHEGNEDDFWRVGHRYAGQKGLEGGINELVHEAVYNYYDHFRTQLLGEIIKRASEKDQRRGVRYDIRQSGNGQINVAQDDAQLEAVQQHGADASEVVQAAVELMNAAQAATDVDSQTRAKLIQLATRVQFELEEEEPSKSKLEEIREKTEGLAGLIASGTGLATKTMQFVNALQQLPDL